VCEDTFKWLGKGVVRHIASRIPNGFLYSLLVLLNSVLIKMISGC
jgi:hypothetical protein